MVNIPENKKLGKRLSRLLMETNKDVMSAPHVPPTTPAPTARSRVLEQDETYRPAWADEFNRETRETALRKLEEERAAEQARSAVAARMTYEAKAADATKAMRAETEISKSSEPSDVTSAGLLRVPQKSKPRGILDWVSRSKPH